MSRTSREIKDLTFEYLLEISAGTCSITDQRIAAEHDLQLREIMAGFLFLHEELELQRRRREEDRAALQAAKEIAEASNRAKTRFLANVSHELRTPMNGVLGMTDLILESGLEGETLRYAQAIHSSARSLLLVINDVLDMAKIESGRLEIRDEPFDVAATITPLVERHAVLAREQRSALHLRYGEGIPRYLVADAGRLSQILTNYLGNAIKFTATGSITLEIECDEVREGRAMLRMAVVDTGIGIAEDQLARLFQPFSQVDDSTTRKFSGTGLGLAISKQLATLMGGQVGVSSTLGRGSTFWLRLPLAIDPARPSASVEARTLHWSPAGSPRVPRVTLEPAEPAPTPTPASPRLRVLLVEDNMINRVVATRMLQRLGCAVQTAVDGVEGLARAEAHTYDLIFMDCQMPRMDGFAATAAIRSRTDDRARVPIVAMTAHAMAGDRERCLAAGMDDYISKPISMGALTEVLERQGGERAAGEGSS